MNLNKNFYRYWVFLLLASFLLLSGCKSAELKSKWRDKDITIDAIDNEWQDKQYYDEKTQTSIGICNDDDYVYMCLSTKDTDIQTAVVQQGFIVWLNGKGSKAKQLGIRFPLVEERSAGGGQGGAPPGGEGGSPPSGGQGAPPGQGAPGSGSQQVSLTELKILTSKKDEGTTFTRDDAEEMGIFTSIRNLNNELIYEVKVPLKKTAQNPYAVVPSELNIIGIGFMLYSSSSRSASGISGFGGSMDMGSGGGMGGGMGGGGMGGGGGGGFDMTSDSSFNIKGNSGMNNIYSFFDMDDDDTSTISDKDVSVINAQPGGGGGGGMGGGGMGGGDMGGDMGGGMGGTTSQTKLEVWCKVTLATR